MNTSISALANIVDTEDVLTHLWDLENLKFTFYDLKLNRSSPKADTTYFRSITFELKTC